jgi:succinoglycan biosynthesis protein ExoM
MEPPTETETVVMHIDVCVATFRRPEGLARLLRSLAAQHLPTPLRMKIIVVDNDASGSAAEVVQAAARQGCPVTYLLQPEKNIALARNTALAHAQGDAVAFIDDDEWADPDWLHCLYRALTALKADALVGPVQGHGVKKLPSWIEKGRFFDAPVRPTGTPIRRGATGNAIVTMSLLQATGMRFEARFGLTGGEDMVFFERLKHHGAKVLWCQEAKVHEAVPPERMTLRWLLRRSFRAAQTYADVKGPPRWRVVWMLYRTVFALTAAFVALLCWPFSRAWATHCARRCVSNLGQLSTLFSAWRYQEYG